MKRILIVGAGFAGSRLAKDLLARGDRVSLIDYIGPFQNERTWALKDHPNLTYNWKALQDLTPEDIEGHDAVIHLAAQADAPMGFRSPKWTIEQNVMGTVCLLEACKKVPIDRLIYAGSGNEWGRGSYFPIDEDHPLTPHHPYAFSKAAAELAMWSYHRCYGIPIVILANGCVIGPGMRKEIFIFKWLYSILSGSPVVLEGGDQTRDITYADDVIKAWLLAIDAKKDDVVGQKFQVSYGEEHSVESILKKCFEICGLEVPISRQPHRPGEMGQRECFSNSKARKVLGYVPEVPLDEALRRTKDWILAEYFDELSLNSFTEKPEIHR